MRGTVFLSSPFSNPNCLYGTFQNSTTSPSTFTHFWIGGFPNCPASAFKNSDHGAPTYNYGESPVMGSKKFSSLNKPFGGI